MFPAMSKYPQFIMEDPWWDYVLLRSAMNIQWTIVIELGFYLVFGFLLLFPIHVTKTLLGVLSCVAFHAFMFPGEATLADVTGMHWGILTSRQRPARWFFFGVLLYAMHMALCKYRDRKTRRLDSAPPSRASKALDQATAIAEAAASAAIAGALIVRCAYWQLEVKRFNIWSDSLDVALVLAVLLGSLWLWPIMWALGNPGLQHLGKISYSVYLTHMFVKQFVHDAGLRKMDSIPHFLLFLAWTAAVSTLTFEFVEKPMNKLLRCRWAPSQMPAWADAPEKDVDESWMTGLPKFMSV